MRQSLPAFAVSFLLACSLSALAEAQPQAFEGAPGEGQPHEALSPDTPTRPEPSSAEPQSIVSTAIHTGFVVSDGRYIPPPYVVEQRGDDVFVNELHISSEHAEGPFFRFGPRPPGAGNWGGGGQSFRFSHAEQQLNNDALLFVLEDGLNGFIVPENAVKVLTILGSNTSTNEKARLLSDGRFPRFDSTEWSTLVERFQTTPGLEDRLRQIQDDNARLLAEADAARRRVALLDSPALKYGVTVIAMVLVVIALGNLLSNHPKRNSRWTDVDQEGDGTTMVMWNVVLLALLNGFDLALSLLAQQAGGFLELNPIGDRLATSPALLATFKISVLLVSCLILVTLRRYRGAQAASWWLCLVCTILTFRWLTYNSMFLA
jgi:uncharacterized protein DUF5658